MEQREIYLYLGKIRNLHRREKQLRDQITDLRMCLLPSGISYDRDKVQTSPEDMTLKVFAQLDEVECKLQWVVFQIYEARTAITNRVFILPPKERQVLLLYYVDCWNMRMISDKLGITERHAFRLKNNGISMLQKIQEGDND